jgi:predicted Zn-dependent protease
MNNLEPKRMHKPPTAIRKHHKRLRPLAVASLAALLSACATSVITPELEDQYGTQMSLQVESQMGLYSDQELEDYVRSVGNRLVASLNNTPYRFRFHIVDQFEPNAFATPGGFIYISRGLLMQMNSEAELAGVVAHEISHVTQRHHAHQIGRTFGTNLFTLPGRAVGVISQDLGNMINAPIEAAGQVYLSSFSRGQETEADLVGMQLAADAGYDPLALTDALQGIERAVEFLTGEKHEASYLDTHPTTPTRIADINKQAQTITSNPTAPVASNAALMSHLDGLWAGPQNPQAGVFREQLFLNADMNFSIQFPPEWETINTPRFVGAGTSEGEAFIALGAADPALSLDQLTSTVAETMYKQAGLEPAVQRSFTVGQWPAQVLRYDDNSGEEAVNLYYLFVKAPHTTFKLMAMGLEHYREDLKATVDSLASLSEEQKKMIGGARLRLAQPIGSDKLEELSEREGNKWPVEYTAIVNGLEADQSLPSDRPLKIMLPERYPD